MIAGIVEELRKNYGVICAEEGDIEEKRDGDDIDLIADASKRQAINQFLENKGFVVSKGTPHKAAAILCKDGYLYKFDIAFDLQYLALLFPRLKLSEVLKERIRKDLELLDFLQVVLFLRGSKKHLDRIDRHFDEYKHFLNDKTYLSPPLLRGELNQEQLKSVAQRKPLALVRYLRLRHLISWLVAGVGRRLALPKRGAMVGVVGVDGAGKSTVVKILSYLPKTRIVYMGDGQFILHKLYSALKRLGKMGRYVSYAMQYLEMWGRYLRAGLLTLRGYRVVIDRYPGFNRHLVLHREWCRPSSFLFALIPRPKRIFFISAPAETIHKRKQELSETEIEKYQAAIRRKVSRLPNALEIENLRLDTTVNVILRQLLR